MRVLVVDLSTLQSPLNSPELLEFGSVEGKNKQWSIRAPDQVECGHHSSLNLGAALDENGIVRVPTEKATELDDKNGKEKFVNVIGDNVTN